MTTTHTLDSSDKTHEVPAFMHGRHTEGQYYTELIRIITGLFVGLLALTTFLLTVGFPRPHAFFSWALYSSIVTLGLNLIAYVVANFFRSELHTKHAAVKVAQDEDETKELESLKANALTARKRLKMFRLVQQTLFVAAVVAMMCLAVATANFFFAIPPTGAPAPQ